ncbi:MAG: hemolysin family protein [Pseudomonadota bacterium]
MNKPNQQEIKPKFVHRLSSWKQFLSRIAGNNEKNQEILRKFDQHIEEDDQWDDNHRVEARALLDNILNLNVIEAEDVMVPSADIVSFSANTKISDALHEMTQKPHSRYLIWGEDRDDVVGFVHIKDMLKIIAENKHHHVTMHEIKRPVLLAVASTQVFDLLLRMRLERTHMATVIDEYGGVDGLITFEDLVEQIVGEINDEHDPLNNQQIIKMDDGSYLVDARIRLDTLEETIGPFASDEEHEECDTIGGLIVTIECRVPIVGEIIKHHTGMEFEIKSANPRLLKRLQIYQKKS